MNTVCVHELVCVFSLLLVIRISRYIIERYIITILNNGETNVIMK